MQAEDLAAAEEAARRAKREAAAVAAERLRLLTGARHLVPHLPRETLRPGEAALLLS